MVTDEDGLYVEALKALINDKDFYSYQNELLIDPQTSYWDKTPPNLIENKELIFVHDKNEDAILQQNNNVIEILSLEPPKIDGDKLIVQINHTLCVTVTLPVDEDNWSTKLTEKDKNQIKTSIGRTNGFQDFKESKSFSSAMNNKWTYVNFKFDNSERKFKITGLETRTV